MAALLTQTRGVKYTNTIRSPLVKLSSHESYESWFATKSKSSPRSAGQCQGLAGQGALAFVRLSGEQAASLVGGLFANKRAALTKQGIKSSWVYKESGEAMLTFWSLTLTAAFLPMR